MLGGWEISGIGRYQTGAPLTIMGDTSIGTRRADYLGGDPYLPDFLMCRAELAEVLLDGIRSAYRDR